MRDWLLDLEGLKAQFDVLRDLDWLRGTVMVVPECEILENDDLASQIAFRSSRHAVVQFVVIPTEMLADPTAASAVPYVHPDRINELRAITSTKFDLSRLIELCEELNKCYASDCCLAVAMLTRAIVDHVPPIFGYQNFDQFASNHSAGSKEGKSFKGSMDHLGKSLKNIADAHLHVQIRNREVIPNLTQVNFSQDLDVLLAEIVRFSK